MGGRRKDMETEKEKQNDRRRQRERQEDRARKRIEGTRQKGEKRKMWSGRRKRREE